MNIDELDTPVLMVDLDQLEKNIKTMADKVIAAGAHIRPHIKTHKTAEVARLQLQHGATGIAVAKVSEAEVMCEAGFDDIFISNIIIGEDKLRRLAELVKKIKIRSGVDSYEAAVMISEAAKKHHVNFEVFLEVNAGLNRAGADPDKAVEIGKQIDELEGIRLVGVMSFAGYKGEPDEQSRRAWAEQEAGIAVRIAEALKSHGIAATEVSVGGSATAVFAASVPGVTEVRPGTYVFNDLNYSRLGVSPLSDCALKIRARVISRPSADRAVIDAGSKVLTTEKKVTPDLDPGHGMIEKYPNTKITALWEEHGVLTLDKEGQELKVGDIVEIIPNHVCPTLNLQDVWYGIRNGQVEKEYHIIARGQVR